MTSFIYFHRIECTHARRHKMLSMCWSKRFQCGLWTAPPSYFLFALFCCANVFLFFSLQDQKKRLYNTMRCNLMHLCGDFKMFKRITHQQKRITNYAFDIGCAHAHPLKFNILWIYLQFNHEAMSFVVALRHK